MFLRLFTTFPPSKLKTGTYYIEFFFLSKLISCFLIIPSVIWTTWNYWNIYRNKLIDDILYYLNFYSYITVCTCYMEQVRMFSGSFVNPRIWILVISCPLAIIQHLPLSCKIVFLPVVYISYRTKWTNSLSGVKLWFCAKNNF